MRVRTLLVTVAVIATTLALTGGAPGAQDAPSAANSCVWFSEYPSRSSGGRDGSIAALDGARWSVGPIEDWSPDRSRVAYVGRDPGDPGAPFGLRTARPDGRANTLLVDAAGLRFSIQSPPVRWSPDGTRIAFVAYRNGAFQEPNLWVVDVRTRARTQVSSGVGPVVDSFDWSPDGTRLVWTEIRPVPGVAANDRLRDVYVGAADGSGTPVRIVETGYYAASSYPLSVKFEPPAQIKDLRFSPDGTQVAFVGYDFDLGSGFSDELWMAEADGSAVTRLWDNTGTPNARLIQSRPSWSPDGTRLAIGLVDQDPSLEGVGIFDVAGRSIERVFRTGNPNSTPVWSADGSLIAFSADRSQDAFEDDVRVANLSTGRLTTVLRGTDTSLAENLVDWVPCDAAPPTCNGAAATVIGTNGRDRLRGTPQRDVIVTFGGNDVVIARGGNDIVCSGSGRDTVRGGPGNDVIRGEGGNDRLFGQAGNDRLFGSGGRDLLVGARGDDRIDGGGGRDQCRPGPGSDRLRRCP